MLIEIPKEYETMCLKALAQKLGWLKPDPSPAPLTIKFSDFFGVNYPPDPKLASGLGIGWARIPCSDPNNWSGTDSWVASAKSQGLQIVIDLGFASYPKSKEFGQPWLDFIQAAVNRYPGVSYFQVWNEPTVEAGFWQGTDQEFANQVYLPAARLLKENGKKVVFGGWPQNGGIPRLLSLLDYADLASVTDVLDIHYYGPEAYQQLLKAWPDKSIWQTEIGFQAGALAGTVQPIIDYLLLHGNWNSPDQYKVFWYAWWGDDRCLDKQNVLTANGQQLKDLAAKYSQGIK